MHCKLKILEIFFYYIDSGKKIIEWALLAIQHMFHELQLSHCAYSIRLMDDPYSNRSQCSLWLSLWAEVL